MLILFFTFHLCKNILGILSEIDHHYLICETCTLKMQNRNRPETLYSKSMMKKPTSSFFSILRFKVCVHSFYGLFQLVSVVQTNFQPLKD